MNLREIKQLVRALTPRELAKLEAWLHTLIHNREYKSTRTTKPHEVLHGSQTTRKSYRLQSIRCGKENCKCREGNLHGPYWYAYWTEKGKIKSQYIGKKLPHKLPARTSSSVRRAR